MPATPGTIGSGVVRTERVKRTRAWLCLTKPAVGNVLQQQARFDAFQTCYNRERPHQALGMKVPGELYTPSPRPYRGLPTLDYPFHDWTATVTNCGRICYKRRKVNLSQGLP